MDYFEAYYKKARIKRHKMTTRSSQQDGVAECKNRTTVEMGLAMLKGRDLPQEY